MKWRLAYLWWLVWGFGRWLWRATETYYIGPTEYWDGSRRTSWKPKHCKDCGWRGPLRWAVHSYDSRGSWDADVVAVNHCPGCRAEI